MQIILEENEYTIQQMCNKLNRFYGGKANGRLFTHRDIAVYMRTGKLPELYGGNPIKWMRQYGFTAITVLPREVAQKKLRPTPTWLKTKKQK